MQDTCSTWPVQCEGKAVVPAQMQVASLPKVGSSSAGSLAAELGGACLLSSQPEQDRWGNGVSA